MAVTLTRSTVSPWLSIWFAPRSTVRRILDADPSRNVYSLPITLLALLLNALVTLTGMQEVIAVWAAVAGVGLLIVVLVLAVWYWVVELKCVGEAHGFSAWRALGAELPAGLAVGAVMLAVALVIGLLIASF